MKPPGEPIAKPLPWDKPSTPASTTPAWAREATSGAAPQNAWIGQLLATAILFAWFWRSLGWEGALALVVGVFVHEYGHVLAINAAGCGPGTMHIVPFLGGAAMPARPPRTELQGVMISLAGPVFGLLAAIPFAGLAIWLKEPNWLTGAVVIVALNLFNLAPAPPLDGSKALGPVLARIHPILEKVVIAGIAALVVAWAVSRQDWLIAAFVAIAGFASLKRTGRESARVLTWSEAGFSTLLWLGALALCLGALWVLQTGLNLPTGSDAVGSLLERFT